MGIALSLDLACLVAESQIGLRTSISSYPLYELQVLTSTRSVPRMQEVSPDNNLSQLSFEVLCEVFEFLDGRDISTLWACGCSDLNKRLGNDGAVKSFSLPIDSRFAPVWPSVLHRFRRLSCFSAKHNVYYNYKPQWTPNLLDLSPNVRKISLWFPNDLQLVMHALRANPLVFRELETLSIGNAVGNDFNESLSDYATKLSNLKKLNLFSNVVQLPATYALPSSHVDMSEAHRI